MGLDRDRAVSVGAVAGRGRGPAPADPAPPATFRPAPDGGGRPCLRAPPQRAIVAVHYPFRHLDAWCSSRSAGWPRGTRHLAVAVCLCLVGQSAHSVYLRAVFAGAGVPSLSVLAL